MLVNLPYLLLAMLLLWFPRQWMRFGKSVAHRRRQRTEGPTRREDEPWKTSEPGDPAVSMGEEFLKIRNYVDLFRATAGGWAVFGGMDINPAFAAPPNAPSALSGGVFGAQVAVVLVGLLTQALRYERGRLLVFAPIFYLAGLSVGLCGLKAASFAFVMIWAVNPMLKNPSRFLAAYALLLWIFGGIFKEFLDLAVIAAFVLAFLPVLLSAIVRRPLVLLSRKSVRTTDTQW